LINLAASDLVMAIFCMPFTFADVVYQRWVFPDAMCPVVLFLQPLSVAASAFTNMAIAWQLPGAVLFHNMIPITKYVMDRIVNGII
jgi:hypothetical protein